MNIGNNSWNLFWKIPHNYITQADTQKQKHVLAIEVCLHTYQLRWCYGSFPSLNNIWLCSYNTFNVLQMKQSIDILSEWDTCTTVRVCHMKKKQVLGFVSLEVFKCGQVVMGVFVMEWVMWCPSGYLIYVHVIS